MIKKIKKYFIFTVLAWLSVACESQEEVANNYSLDCISCNDVFLDPMYNHFYTTDRTKPFTGKCESKNSQGLVVLEKNFIEGKLEGAYFEYYDDGSIKSEWNFLKNRQHGQFKGYSPNGTLEYHSVYYKGDLDSVIYP